MLHQRLLLVFLSLHHVFGAHYYYSHDSSDDQGSDEAFYKFKYGVRDPNTGDVKNQWEVRKGDKVKGEYSLVEPDGTLRTVQYSADKENGFNAVVKREGKSRHPTRNHHNYKTYLLADPHGLAKEAGRNRLPEQEEPETRHPEPYRYREPVPMGFYPEEGYEVVESERKAFYSLPDVPANHSPVYTGVSDYNKLINMYKTFRKQSSDPKKSKFDYGINEYFENGYAALKRRLKKNQSGLLNLSSRLEAPKV